jgi:hypothetical protein
VISLIFAACSIAFSAHLRKTVAFVTQYQAKALRNGRLVHPAEALPLIVAG